MATYFETTGTSIEDAFLKFHADNPEVYQLFKGQALEAISKGKTKISAKLLLNWIRWNTFLESDGHGLKLNDAFQSFYPRMFIAEYPKYAEIFNFRKQRCKEDGPYMEVDEDGQFKFL